MNERVERKILPPDSKDFYENVPYGGSETYSLSGILARYVKDGADKVALASAAMETMKLLNVSQELIDNALKFWGSTIVSTPSAHAWLREAAEFKEDELLTESEAGHMFVNALRRGILPKEIFASFYDRWVQELQVVRVALAFEFKDAKVNYLARLASGSLPFTVSPEQLQKFEERTSRLKFGVLDPTDWYYLPAYGGYFPHTVRIKAMGVEREQRYATYGHELSHGVLSGRLLHKHKKGDVQDISPTKNGLRMRSYEFTERTKDKLINKDDKMAWLDEAATELLSSWIQGRRPRTYKAEVGVLEALVKDGLNPQVLFDAYAEDYHPGEKGLPAVKKLMAEIFRIRGKEWFYEQQRRFSGTIPDAS